MEGSATTIFRVEDSVCRFLQQVSTHYHKTWHLVPENSILPSLLKLSSLFLFVMYILGHCILIYCLITTFLQHRNIHNFQLQNNNFAVLSVHLQMPTQAPLVMSTPNTNQFKQTYSVTTLDFMNNNEFTNSKICHMATIPPNFSHTWLYVMNGFSCAYYKITTSSCKVSVMRPKLAINN